MILTDTALTMDVPNKNGRIYPKKVLEEALQKYKKLVDEKRALGCIGMSDSETIDLTKVSHIVEHVDIIAGEVVVTIRTLNTPEGKKADELLTSNNYCLRPTGLGKLSSENVMRDYEFIGFNIILKKDAA